MREILVFSIEKKIAAGMARTLQSTIPCECAIRIMVSSTRWISEPLLRRIVPASIITSMTAFNSFDSSMLSSFYQLPLFYHKSGLKKNLCHEIMTKIDYSF
ncbi:Uncharacterised protein [Streptococcus pneumoniae]|nr:Uncharacterised protein [Streptococcus pneumoniae]